MPNTNGMRFPMTALADFHHKFADANVKSGAVFDAVSKTNCDALKAAGSAVAGDKYNSPHDFKTALGGGVVGLPSGMVDATESSTAKALGNPQSAIAENAATSGTPGNTPPEAPVIGTDTDFVNQQGYEGSAIARTGQPEDLENVAGEGKELTGGADAKTQHEQLEATANESKADTAKDTGMSLGAEATTKAYKASDSKENAEVVKPVKVDTKDETASKTATRRSGAASK